MDEKEIAKIHFLPFTSLIRAQEFIENTYSYRGDTRCKRNLAKIQLQQILNVTDVRQRNWRNKYYMALCRAIYAHEWNNVLYLLKKSPIWEHSADSDEIHIYIRVLTILLMNHPSAKDQALLHDYVHMVLACRSVQDKRALYKALLHLPEKLYGTAHSG